MAITIEHEQLPLNSVLNATRSDSGGEEAQGSPLQPQLRSTAQRASCPHLSGENILICIKHNILYVVRTVYIMQQMLQLKT